jgi:hypothetical protein
MSLKYDADGELFLTQVIEAKNTRIEALEKALLKANRALASYGEPLRLAPDAAWPIGCHSPNSCHRHGQCMYSGCKYDGADIAALAAAALAPEQDKRPMNRRTK